MGLFSKLFGKAAADTQEEPVYFADGEDERMQQAVARARETFKYCWRECYWEGRRIIPALDMAMVKAAFSEEAQDGDTITEHMWLNEIYFDGHTVYGTLVNTPNGLTQVAAGDRLALPLAQISDWLMVCEGKTYGGFTVHAMRAQMDAEELREHDAAWGLDFGDYRDIEWVRDQKSQPDNLVEHPMSRNMREKIVEALTQHPSEVHAVDEDGYTWLHRAAVAGNLNEVEVLLAAGADSTAQTPQGDTALTLAKTVGWPHIIRRLEH